MTWRVIQADALEGLRSLPDESVQCVVTSPPYWGLRDYGVPGQLGLEPTPEKYVARMVEVFREVRRVLRRDAVCWLNLGDGYAGNRSYQVPDSKNKHHVFGVSNALGVPPGLKPKDLVGIPWRVAFALQADGWYLRSDIIWAKPNPMPESVRDRPTKAHEYLFLLTKSERYFWDQEAVREPSETDPREHYGDRAKVLGRGMQPGSRASTSGPQQDNSGGFPLPTGGRNIRSVWTIATQPFAQCHFATFPPELPRRCILAGTSERGCCPECGAPWERVIEEGELVSSRLPNANPEWREPQGPAVRVEHDRESRRGIDGITINKTSGWSHLPRRERETTGWRPTCNHGTEHPIPEEDLAADESLLDDFEIEPHPPVPCVVLDPFAGSGTTGMVALQLGRDFIGIELSAEYAAMAERRIGEADTETVLERGGKLAAITGPLFEVEP